MIEDLLFKKLEELEKRVSCLENIIKLSMEGLNAVYKYGDTHKIAEKTLEQIKNVDDKNLENKN